MVTTTSARRTSPPPASAGAGEGWEWSRLLLLALLVWWTVRLVVLGGQWIFLDYPNLAFHEAGHVFTVAFGEFVHYLGGSLFQLVVPALLIAHFLLRARSPLGGAFCLWWLGESLHNVSIYMADAWIMALPLVGGGDHDWRYLFGRLGVLEEASVEAIAMSTAVVATIVMVAGLAWCAVLAAPAPFRDRVRGVVAERAPLLADLVD
jgi:hypothetical protein